MIAVQIAPVLLHEHVVLFQTKRKLKSRELHRKRTSILLVYIQSPLPCPCFTPFPPLPSTGGKVPPTPTPPVGSSPIAPTLITLYLGFLHTFKPQHCSDYEGVGGALDYCTTSSLAQWQQHFSFQNLVK